MSPVLAGGFSTTAPPGKPSQLFLKSVPDDLNIWISGPSIDLFLLSIYFHWSFTLVRLVIFNECQTLSMKNWTLNDDDVIFFYRGFILSSDRQLEWGGERGKDYLNLIRD